MVGRLEGKVAIITGASTGLGRGIARQYAQEGAKVAIFDIVEEQLAGNFDASAGVSTANVIKEDGGEALYFRVDATGDRQHTTDAMAEVVKKFGKLDIFVPCAGVYCPLVPFHEQTLESLDRCLAVQTRGAFVQTQEAIKIMLTQASGGNIVQLVSTAGLGGHPNQGVYDMSKGAQAQMTRVIAAEYGPDKIRCNGICPTWIKTALTAKLHADPAFQKLFSGSIPARRWGEVSDVANLAVYLGSDESSYMTGELIRIDGGELLSRYSK